MGRFSEQLWAGSGERHERFAPLSNWPESHFVALGEQAVEHYYPPGSLLDEIVIDCVEPSSDGPGGLFSTTQPSGATGLRGDGTPRSDRFTTDGMVPPPDDVLVPMVTDFVLQQLRTAASPPPGEPKPLAG